MSENIATYIIDDRNYIQDPNISEFTKELVDLINKYSIERLCDVPDKFSKDNNIVESDEWANLKEENRIRWRMGTYFKFSKI